MKLAKIFCLVIILSIFCVCVFLGPALSKGPEPAKSDTARQDIYKELELFGDAITTIEENYVEEAKPKNLIYGALKGMLRSLDTHSDFLTPQQYEDIKVDTGGEFGGIGIEVTVEDGLLTVVSPLKGTPADKAGILPGDKIVKIDNEPAKDLTLDDAVEKLRGIPGSELSLTIMRADEEKLKDFTIKRAVIKIESIDEALILKDNIGYIRIIEFQAKTAHDLERALRKLEKEKLSALILDLRNNPGGLLEASIAVSEKFLPRGATIVSIKGRAAGQQEIFTSQSLNPRLNFPVVVLVNKGSASASEIVAAAIKENKRGALVGTATFGKGSVQTVIPMRDGSALRLTTAKYYTPLGHEIHKNGISPDVLIEQPQDVLLDNQIEKAIEILKGETQRKD